MQNVLKTNLGDQSGLTLTELLVASILIGIVMVGVVGFTSSINQMQNTTSKAARIELEGISTMISLTKDAKRATGESSSPGITWDDSGSSRNICFRIDTANTASDYTDDTWTCWAHNNDFILHRCENLLIPLGNNGICSSPYQPLKYVLTQSDFFEVITTSGIFDEIQFDINLIYDDSVSADPIENPTFSIRTTVNPISHSRS